MQQIFAVNKKTNIVVHQAANLALIKTRMKELGEKEEDFYILGDIDMKYVSRIVYVDGECIYNNKDFWSKNAEEIYKNFEKHEVEDFLGQPVDLYRFATEMNSNITRIAAIDGLSGEVLYNIEVAAEFISLFKEETVYTDFVNITPDELMVKLAPVVVALNTGSFREAKHAIMAMENDSFLTPERVAKYVAMMDAADAIDYAEDSTQKIYTASMNV